MRGTPIPITDFHAGVNTKAAPALVQPNECRDCLNVVSTTTGSLKKRNGNQTFSSAFTGAPTAIISLEGVETTGPFLVATAGTKFYSIGTTGVNTDITGASVVTSNAKWEIVEAPVSGGQGPVYAMNGVDTPKYWTGAGNIADWTAASGSLPNGKFCIYFKNKVWVAGTASNPSRLYWSDVGDPRAWPAPNVIDFDPNDGDAITGIGVCGPYIVVFKRNKMYRVHDLNTGANTAISTNVGCASHRSIVDTPLGCFFLTNDKGIYLYTGSQLRQMSIKISPTVDNIIPAARDNAAGIFFNNHYYLSICTSGTTNNITLDYDSQLDSWWFHSNTSNKWVIWRRTNVYELFSAQAGAGIVDFTYQTGITQDNGANFTCNWLGPWLTFGGLWRHLPWSQPYRKKRWRMVQFNGLGVVDSYLGKDYLGTTLLQADLFNGTVNSTTFGGANNFGGIGTFGDLGLQTSIRVYSEGVAYAFSVQFQSTNSNIFEVDSYTPFITPRNN